MTYALGRGLEYYDMPTVRGIVDAAARRPQVFSVVLGIVESVPFRERVAQPRAPPPLLARSPIRTLRRTPLRA